MFIKIYQCYSVGVLFTISNFTSYSLCLLLRINMDDKRVLKTLCCDIWHSDCINNYPIILVLHLSSMFTNYALHSRSTLCPRNIAIFIDLNTKRLKNCAFFKNVILWHVKDMNMYAFTTLSFDWRYRNNID